jgi:hypothetical protein
MAVDLIVGMVLVVTSIVTLIVQKTPTWRRRWLLRKAARESGVVISSRRAKSEAL